MNTKEIKKRIIDCGITASDLATKCNVSSAKMSLVINNHQDATLELAEKMQHYLSISDDEFAHYFLRDN